MVMPLASTLSLFTLSSSLLTAVSAEGNWISNWSGAERIITNSFDHDPLDARSVKRGSGKITLGNGIAKFNGSPRLYISKEAGVDGWENVEITAYGKYVDQGAEPFKSYSGLTLVTRSNHDNYGDSPCDAFGYYARIYQESGECAFQKEYAHSTTAGTVYTKTKRVDCFAGGLPLGQWVGMKFKVTTQPGTSNVLLELYVDENDDGNWLLKHSVTDTPGYWFSTSSTTVPSECPQNDGDTVVRPGNVSFLRTDGVDETTEVHWRDASIINSLSGDGTTTLSPTKTPTTAPVKFTVSPTTSPIATTDGPTSLPTKTPTAAPVKFTVNPTTSPTTKPTDSPVALTNAPTDHPTTPLTTSPITAPTTRAPTDAPVLFVCGSIGSKGTCNDNALCTWEGSPNDGSCVESGGGGGGSCAASGESCANASCCIGTCPGGNPKTRFCP
mmetsp:Transcript_53989/g.114685  ORF Transcript_53989/g.114685 Transcript_53989/m.114685 type:complete len:441 (+) Transcript_53989:89-1411(+)